jgi:hypothetical protein
MKVRQHIADFCSGVKPVEAEVETLDQLLALDFVRRWDDELLDCFCRAVGYPERDIVFLMAKMKDPENYGSFWVLAHVSPQDALAALPLLDPSTGRTVTTKG